MKDDSNVVYTDNNAAQIPCTRCNENHNNNDDKQYSRR